MALHSSHTVIPANIKTKTSLHSRRPFTTKANQNTSFNHTNMGSIWTIYEIAEAVKGEILKTGPPGTISTDTRTMKSSNLSSSGHWFFAIVGKKSDAHDFITADLYKNGCVGVIGRRVCENWNRGFVKLQEKDDTVTALEKMAKYARKRYKGCVVGVTGSVGKTTTRTMIALALESLGLVYQTQGNQNNRIGVALSLIRIPGDAEVTVLELGMCRKGEILELARVCDPSVRVILNVGPCHLENFEDLEEVAGAKSEILMEAKPGDVCILNADDPLVMNLSVPPGVKKLPSATLLLYQGSIVFKDMPIYSTQVLFGRRVGCDVRLLLAEVIDGGDGVKVVLEKGVEVVEITISSPGLHLALNACAAAAVAITMGVSLAQVGVSLSRFTPVHMRSALEIAQNGIKIINDVYNANPTSVNAAISLIKAINCSGKRVAILGDMLELGATEIKAHETVLDLCCDARIGLVALVGKRFLVAAENLNIAGKMDVICTLDAGSLALQIMPRLTSNDVVLVKGSRGMQMEKVVDAIKNIQNGRFSE